MNHLADLVHLAIYQHLHESSQVENKKKNAKKYMLMVKKKK